MNVLKYSVFKTDAEMFISILGALEIVEKTSVTVLLQINLLAGKFHLLMKIKFD